MDAPKNFVPEPFDYHQEVTVRIDSLTNLGVGLGRIDGWVVMVPFSLPGERVRASVFRNRSNYSEADLVEVLEPSPERVLPRCPLFGRCGGCQYQHLAYESQLDWKRNQVKEAMERIGGIQTEIRQPVPSPVEYGYRSKLTPHYQRWQEDGNFPIGFLRFGQRNRLIDVPECPIATPGINRELPNLRERTKMTPPKRKKKGATLLLREAMEGVVTDPEKMITERVGNRIFQFKAGEFFQNNPHILPQFAEFVTASAAAGGMRYLVDAYCGSGLFALTGSHLFEKVIGIEVSTAAVTLADSNAALNRIDHAIFRAGDAGDLFEVVSSLPPTETAVVLDPPRKGCDAGFLTQLIRFSPRRVVYVSCDPVTQARDLKTLIGGGYEPRALQPFDLFPQTRHIENVAVLERR